MLLKDPESIERLRAKYGSRNLEDALVFITNAHTPQGLACLIDATEEMVDKILGAVHKGMVPEGPDDVALQPAV